MPHDLPPSDQGPHDVLLGLTQQDLGQSDRRLVFATLKRVEAAGSELTGTAQTMARIQRALGGRRHHLHRSGRKKRSRCQAQEAIALRALKTKDA